MAATTITTTITSSGSNVVTDPELQAGHTIGNQFVAASDVNDAPGRVKFAYWVPNVSGGLVISKIPQKTKCVIRSLFL